jgi:hypothetical protein
MRSTHFIGGVGIMFLVLLLAVQGAFGVRGSANAQEVVAPEGAIDPADVTRVHLEVKENDTCWELADTYLGSGLRCPDLVEANSDRLRWNDGGDVGLVAGRYYWLPESWVVPFLESERTNRTHLFVIHVRAGTDLGGIDTVDPTAQSFVDSDPVRVGNFGGARANSEAPHDCTGWFPSDLMCDGGTTTVIVGLLLITVAGVIFTVVKRRSGSNWPFD